MLSRNYHIISLNEKSNKLVLIDEIFDDRTKFNFNLYDTQLNLISPADIKQIYLSENKSGRVILMSDGRVYYYYRVTQCYGLVSIPDVVVKISQDYNYNVAISESGILYLFDSEVRHSVTIPNEIIIDYNGKFLLTASGLLYNYDICVCRICPVVINTTVSVAKIVAHKKHVFFIDIDDNLYAIVNNSLRQVKFAIPKNISIKIKYAAIKIFDTYTYSFDRYLIIVDHDDNIIECRYNSKKNICSIIHNINFATDSNIIDILNTKYGRIVVTSDGKIYNLETRKFLKYYQDHPLNIPIKRSIKSARSTKN